MKNNLFILLMIFIVGCGGPSTEAYTDSTVAIIDTAIAESPINPIIGKTYKIGNIEVAEKDFSNMMNWQIANNACESLGNGWRLPTKDELNILYQNKDKIGGFTDIEYSFYWSSTEGDNGLVWYQFFDVGDQYSVANKFNGYVRAVRTIK